MTEFALIGRDSNFIFLFNLLCLCIYIYTSGMAQGVGKGRERGEIDCCMQIATLEKRTGIYFVDERKN
jgi:hypothetical protein